MAGQTPEAAWRPVETRPGIVVRFTIPGVRAEGEAGAMGIALHPRFGSGGFLYVCVSRMDEGQWRNQVLRYKVSASNGFSFSKYIIRRGMLAAGRHNGCRIRFSPGSLLYVTMGDANVESRAQDPDSLNGKVLRVNSDGTIPADNPILPGARGRSATYTWGHRNPQGFAFRPGSSARFAAEHGPDEHDEINGIVAGRNFGWPIASGPDGPGGFVDPVWASGRPTIAPSGIAFAAGAAWSSFRNHLFVATLKEQDLRRFTIGTTSVVQRAVYFNGRWGRLRAVVSGSGGALYITTSNGSNDRVIRIRPILP